MNFYGGIKLTFRNKVDKKREVDLKRIAVVLIFIFGLTITCYAAETLTVDEAIDLALTNNESYINAKNDLEKAKSKVTETRASAFPQLTANGTFLRNWELSTLVTGTDYYWTGDLTVTQPIYNGGQVFTAWSIAKLYRSLTEHQLNLKTQQLKLDVIKTYYGVVMADELVRVAQQTVDLAQASLDVVNNMAAQGTVSDYEVLMAEVRLANYKPSLIQAKAAAKLAHQNLNNIIGLKLNEDTQAVWTMDSTLYYVPDYNLDSLKIAAIDDRPEMAIMRYQTKMYKKNISIANAGYRPNINFVTTLQYTTDAKWPGKNDWERNYYSGIVVSIPIFDSWRTPAKVKQAKIEYKQSELSEMELEDNLKLDIEQNWWNYQKARESLASCGQAVEMLNAAWK